MGQNVYPILRLFSWQCWWTLYFKERSNQSYALPLHLHHWVSHLTSWDQAVLFSMCKTYQMPSSPLPLQSASICLKILSILFRIKSLGKSKLVQSTSTWRKCLLKAWQSWDTLVDGRSGKKLRDQDGTYVLICFISALRQDNRSMLLMPNASY